MHYFTVITLTKIGEKISFFFAKIIFKKTIFFSPAGGKAKSCDNNFRALESNWHTESQENVDSEQLEIKVQSLRRGNPSLLPRVFQTAELDAMDNAGVVYNHDQFFCFYALASKHRVFNFSPSCVFFFLANIFFFLVTLILSFSLEFLFSQKCQ